MWSVWIFWLGTDDRREVVGLPGVASEAAQHIVAFALLAALVMAAVRARPWAVFATVALAGVAGEFIQLAASSRTFSVHDMLFSAVGAAIGAVIGAAACRRQGWSATVAVMLLAGLVVASAPFALRLSVTGSATALPADCPSPPPPAPGTPEVVLNEQFATGGDGEWPVEIEEPTAAELRARLVATNEFSVNVVFRTTDLGQTGPVRLFTISDRTANNRANFQISLERNDLRIRLRTACKRFNAVVAPDVVRADTVHRVDVTWGAGTLEVWVDAVKVKSTSLPWGDLTSWNPTYSIVVGDTAGGGRRFDGSVYSVTMWDRALGETFIVANSAP